MDIGHRRYKTFGELYQYCYRVASTVGLVCVQIFGCEEAASRDYAVDLGVALQLTNILRDVPADLAQGRLYIPLDELERFGCTEEALLTTPRAAPVRALLAFQGARAREYYGRASRNMSARRGETARRRRDHVGDLSRYPRRDRAARLRRLHREGARAASAPRLDRRCRVWLRVMFGLRGSLSEAAREVSKRFGGPLS